MSGLQIKEKERKRGQRARVTEVQWFEDGRLYCGCEEGWF